MEKSNIKKAKDGIRTLISNGEKNLKPFALEVLANLYSKGMLTDPATSQEKKILYGVICGATGIDALLRISTGYGIETYVKATLEKAYNFIGSKNKVFSKI